MGKGLFVAAATLIWSVTAVSYNSSHLDKCKRLKQCSGKDLSGASFVGGEYGGVSFRGSNLKNAVFEGVGLGSADFRSNSVKTNLQNTVFKEDTYLEGANFEGVSKTKGMVIRGLYAHNTNFRYASLNEVLFISTRFTSSDFRNVEFNNSKLDRCNFTSSKFQRVVIKGSKVWDNYFNSTQFNNAVFQKKGSDGVADGEFLGNGFGQSSWTNANVKWIVFGDKRRNCHFNHARDFGGSNFNNSDVRACNATNVDWDSSPNPPRH